MGDEVKSIPDCPRALLPNKTSRRDEKERARVGYQPNPLRRGFSLVQSWRKKVERDLAFLLPGFISDRRNIKPVRQS